MSIIIQRSLSGGELDPSLHSRVDLARYQNGAKKIKNAFVKKPGGISGRGGFQFVNEVLKPATATILIPFIFNDSNAYLLEFGDVRLRVLKNGEYITYGTSVNISAVTNAAQGVLTQAGLAPGTGANIVISGCTSMPLLNGSYIVENTGASTFKLKDYFGNYIDTTLFGTYVANDAQYEEYFAIVSPYAVADLPALQFDQKTDVMTIVHPDYAPRYLSRPTTDTSWAFSFAYFAPNSISPTISSVAQGGATGAETIRYAMTRVSASSGEESFVGTPVAITNGNAVTSTANYVRVSFGAPTPDQYVIYREKAGVYGFLAIVEGSATYYDDIGLEPDYGDNPPIDEDLYDSTNNYPSAIASYQQRQFLGNTNTDPEEIRASRVGQYTNFTKHSTIQDDDAIRFNLFGKQVNAVKYMLDVGKLVILTHGAGWWLGGDSSGALIPGEINPRRFSTRGAKDSLPPIQYDNSLIFVPAQGTEIRDVEFDANSDGYKSSDMSIMARHLFKGKEIVDWALQETPDSILWVVLDDGTMVACTYIKEHEILAWHRHDTDGLIERVCSIPEGGVDVLYAIIQRDIDGVSTRYLERLTDSEVYDILDSTILDSHLSYDGRNTGSTTMTLSGGTTWAYDETITLTASDSFFLSTDVGNEIQITGPAGELIRFSINTYSSATVVTGRPHMTVPVSMRSVAFTEWAKAVDELIGLKHIEGKDVSVFADGNVVSSPNNSAYPTLTISGGSLTLDRPYAVIHVGLPFTSDFETLDIDTINGETMIDKKQIINEVFLKVSNTRVLYVGAQEPTGTDMLENLRETKNRDSEGYEQPAPLVSGDMQILIDGIWNTGGRVFVRNVDPVPFTINSIAPKGMIPRRGG